MMLIKMSVQQHLPNIILFMKMSLSVVSNILLFKTALVDSSRA